MHVGDLDGVVVKLQGNWEAKVTITVHDNNHNPVANATVTGDWSGGYVGIDDFCLTCGSGQCTVTSGSIANKDKNVTFMVSNVEDTLTYEQSDNHDPADINPSIVVNK